MRIGEGTGIYATRADGARLQVLFNPTFSSVLTRPDDDRVGLTGERRPDIVIAADGPMTGWIALDAKYVVGQKAVSSAFASAHVYRDGALWHTHGGRPVACVLLAPIESSDCSGWFAADFRDRHGLGVVRLRPGEDGDARELAGWALGRLGL